MKLYTFRLCTKTCYKSQGVAGLFKYMRKEIYLRSRLSACIYNKIFVVWSYSVNMYIIMSQRFSRSFITLYYLVFLLLILFYFYTEFCKTKLNTIMLSYYLYKIQTQNVLLRKLKVNCNNYYFPPSSV